MLRLYFAQCLPNRLKELNRQSLNSINPNNICLKCFSIRRIFKEYQNALKLRVVMELFFSFGFILYRGFFFNLYCSCFNLCNVRVFFANMCTCIYCVLYCLYCVFGVVSFMSIYSYLFCLY